MVSRRLVSWLLAATLLCGGVVADEARWAEHVLAAQDALLRGDYATAERHTEAALGAAEDFGPQDWRLAITLEKLASFYRAEERYADAAPLYRRLLEMDDAMLGRDHPSATARAKDLAAIYRLLGRQVDATHLLHDRKQ